MNNVLHSNENEETLAVKMLKQCYWQILPGAASPQYQMYLYIPTITQYYSLLTENVIGRFWLVQPSANTQRLPPEAKWLLLSGKTSTRKEKEARRCNKRRREVWAVWPAESARTAPSPPRQRPPPSPQERRTSPLFSLAKGATFRLPPKMAKNVKPGQNIQTLNKLVKTNFRVVMPISPPVRLRLGWGSQALKTVHVVLTPTSKAGGFIPNINSTNPMPTKHSWMLLILIQLYPMVGCKWVPPCLVGLFNLVQIRVRLNQDPNLRLLESIPVSLVQDFSIQKH